MKESIIPTFSFARQRHIDRTVKKKIQSCSRHRQNSNNNLTSINPAKYFDNANTIQTIHPVNQCLGITHKNVLFSYDTSI